MTVGIPRESVEQLETSITATVDPTASDVDWAIVEVGSRPSGWIAGSWDGAAVLSQGRYTAVTVSPSVGTSGADFNLTAGTRYEMFVRVTDVSESMVRSVGVLVLT